MGYSLSFVLSSFITCFGSSMLYGYNIGVLNTPTKIIRQYYNETYLQRGSDMSDAKLDLLWSVTVSIFVAAGCIGAFSTNAVAEYFGRKNGLLFNHTFMFIGALLEGLSRVCKAPEMLIVGRFFVGINCGMCVGLSTVYLSEISPKNIRGALVTCHQLFVTVGIMIAQIFGLNKLLGTMDLWPVLVGLTGVPALISALTLPWSVCPESPRFLYIKKGRKDEARNALVRLRGTDDVDEEMEEMEHETQENAGSSQQTTSFRIIDLFKRKELRMALIISLVLQVAQQWSGINAVFFYASTIFEEAGVAQHAIQYAVMGTGIVNVVATIISVPLVEATGRRPLLLWPTLVMIASCVVLVISITLQAKFSWLTYVSIVMVHVFVVGFAIGLGPVPQCIVCETFRQEARGAAASVAQGLNWFCNFVLALSFVFLQKWIQAYVFLIFGGILTCCFIFMLIYLPETKDRTFDEVARDLAMGSSVWRRKHAFISEDQDAQQKLKDKDTDV